MGKDWATGHFGSGKNSNQILIYYPECPGKGNDILVAERIKEKESMYVAEATVKNCFKKYVFCKNVGFLEISLGEKLKKTTFLFSTKDSKGRNTQFSDAVLCFSSSSPSVLLPTFSVAK